MRQIVLDTETTGLSPSSGHRIIEIGALELVNRRLTGKHFHYYINPNRAIDRGAVAVHGITTEFLQDKPPFGSIAEELIEFISGAEVIIHNAPFDVGFLDHEFSLLNRNLKAVEDYCKIFDTLLLARRMHPGQKNNLDALCKRYFVDNSQRDLHGALLDARILTHVYLAMTGGQSSLFDETEEVTGTTAALLHKGSSPEQPATTVRVASPDELAEHKEYLAMLRKTAKEVEEW